MTTLAIAPVNAGEFHARPSFDGTVLKVELDGTADLRAAPVLETFMPDLHQEALRLRVAEVVVDLRALEFMNSSCFKSFVNWLSDLQDLPAEQVYMVRIQSDPGKHWQKRSLSALSCFAVDLVRLE
jgi:anti-anti-sigma regulatory factor